MIEFSIIGTPAELDVIVLALGGVLDGVTEGSPRYPGNDLRSRVYVRAAAVLPEFLCVDDPAPLASSPAGSSPADEFPAPMLSPEDTSDGPSASDLIGTIANTTNAAVMAGVELYEVPTFAGDPPAPRQRYNPELGRHAWWHPVEHWYVCLHCGVLKHKREAGGGRWCDEWGYRNWPAVEWGSNRGGGPFPRCPGPGANVSRMT